MTENKFKTPKKGAGKRLRDVYEKNREKSKPSETLLDILKDPKTDEQKKSAIKRDAEI